MLRIGNVEIKNPVVLAPMAGVCNSAFRLTVKEFGVGLVCAEMVSDKGIVYGNERTLSMLYIDEQEKPLSLQIFGGEEDCSLRLRSMSTRIQTRTLLTLIWGVPLIKSLNVKQELAGF